MQVFQERFSPTLVLALSGILLIGVLDYRTGVELDFSIFYLLPIYWIAWQGGVWPGAVASLAGAIAWLVADLLGGHVYSSVLMPVWSTLFRLAVFSVTAFLLARLRAAQERRRVFERLFFHDILNIVGAIRGYAELLQRGDLPERQEIFHIIHAGANQIIDQIEFQKTVAAAQNRELTITPMPLQSRSFLESQVKIYNEGDIVRERCLVISPDADDIPFESDPVLLGRVLGNMLKNALEATEPGGTVTAACTRVGEEIEFRVHNPGHIPPPVQARIFRSGFSTKATGRGLGTYSMQLLSRYLKGRITFSSSPGSGTVFRARYPLKW